MDLLEYTTLFLFACLCHGEETPCSRFHYEEQTLEKIVRLEHRFEQLEAKTNSKGFQTEKNWLFNGEYRRVGGWSVGRKQKFLCAILPTFQKNFEPNFLRSIVIKCIGAYHRDCDTTYSCPDTWIRFKGSCYLFPPGLLTFHDAELLCFQLGSNLVHIENEAENNFLKHHMKDLKVSNYWTGLIRDKSGQWIWFDNGETASFTDWSSHSPNNHGGNQDCVYLQESFNFQWNDIACNSVYRAICELKIESA